MNNFSLRFNTYYRLGLTEYVFLFIILFASFYFGLGSYAISNAHEGLSAEVAREMLQLGSYVIPKLNYVPYIEKPPLFYWLIAASYKLFGISEWSARIIPATAASLLCISFVSFGNSIRRNREGWLAALILASSIGFMVTARVLVFDMLLTLFFSASMLFFYEWYKTESKLKLRCFYFSFALAILTQGILAFILIAIVVGMFIFSMPKRGAKIRKLLDPLGITLWLLLLLPWHYAAMALQAHFAWDYFVNGQMNQLTGNKLTAEWHNAPIYFYVPKLVLFLFPWSLLAIFLWQPVKRIETSLHRFLWLWFFIPFLILSLISVKSSYAVILTIPPLAFLLAIKLNELLTNQKNNLLLYFFAFLAVLETSAFGLLYYATHTQTPLAHLPEILRLDSFLAQPLFYFFLASSIFSVLGLVIALVMRRFAVVPFVGIVCLMMFLVIFNVIDKRLVEYRHSERVLASYLLEHDPNRAVYLYKDYQHISSLPFYVKKRLAIINNENNVFSYGINSPLASGWFHSAESFKEKVADQSHYVIVKKDKFVEFMRLMAPRHYCIVAQSGRSLLLSQQSKDCG